MSHWSALLTREQIEAQRAITAKLDPTFAKLDAEFWDTRTADQLRNLAWGAWNCNEGGAYQMARSLLALMGHPYPGPSFE